MAETSKDVEEVVVLRCILVAHPKNPKTLATSADKVVEVAVPCDTDCKLVVEDNDLDADQDNQNEEATGKLDVVGPAVGKLGAQDNPHEPLDSIRAKVAPDDVL